MDQAPVSMWRMYRDVMRFMLTYVIAPIVVLWTLGDTFIGHPRGRLSDDDGFWVPARFPDEGWIGLWHSFLAALWLPVVAIVVNGALFLVVGLGRRGRAQG